MEGGDRLAHARFSQPQVKNPAVATLFGAFRKAVLALDPCVSEEILKLYIAYKAETNFVDVVPRAKRLRLSLNMRFHEINDPRRLCKDVTALGRWGNGDVEVGLSSLDDLPYVRGLVRQAFERRPGASVARSVRARANELPNHACAGSRRKRSCHACDTSKAGISRPPVMAAGASHPRTQASRTRSARRRSVRSCQS